MNKEIRKSGEPIQLDKQAKILLLNILKKGYVDDDDRLTLSRFILFSVPITDWIDMRFKRDE